MKPLITDKKYDIKNAQLIAEYNNSLPDSDPAFVIEELYSSQSGDFFLYGRGGANTPWGNESCQSGEAIRALTAKQAAEWVDAHHDDPSKYADLFRDAEE